MAKLAISIDFLDDYHRLEKRQRNRVLELARIFADSTPAELSRHKGVHLEPHNNAADPRSKTVRIDSNFRGIVLDLGDNETYLLTKIGSHDDTDRWMANNQFKVNAATGALEILNVAAIAAAVGEIGTQPVPEIEQLFAHRKDKDFTQLGINEDLVLALRALTSEDELLSLLSALPTGQHDALIALTGDETVEQIYQQVAGDIHAASIDTEDLAAALEAPASQSSFHVFTDEEELSLMLNEPLAKWRVYLHHTQRTLAERESYNGPVRVTGGAGTGKTIVAIHRARFLADRVEDRSQRTILFTTFTKNLAEAIERQLVSLAGREVLEAVEVSNVDALAYRVVREAEGSAPTIIDAKDDARLWEMVRDNLGLDFSAEFMRHEWEQVVLAQDIDSRSDYFLANRAGRGVRLDRRNRAKVWKGIEAYLHELDRQNKRTFLQLSAAAAGYLSSRQVKPYNHVVVDEAQDLHEAQWRMLRAAVAEAPNDMFIVGDSHQRIYDRRSSLSKVGINIRGRSKRLRVNYRTTRQILRWAMALLGEEVYDDLDEGTDDQTGSTYYSHLNGLPPVVLPAKNAKEQYGALAAQVKQWIDDGIEPEAIGVIARTTTELDGARSALTSAGVSNLIMGREIAKGDGVRLGSMHRTKGLEFMAVAVINVDDDTVPAHWELTDKSADEVQHRVDLMRERCLLYVACTRARDHLWVGWSGKPSRFIEPMLSD